MLEVFQNYYDSKKWKFKGDSWNSFCISSIFFSSKCFVFIFHIPHSRFHLSNIKSKVLLYIFSDSLEIKKLFVLNSILYDKFVPNYSLTYSEEHFIKSNKRIICIVKVKRLAWSLPDSSEGKLSV